MRKTITGIEGELPISLDPYWLDRLFVANHAKSTSVLLRGPIDFDTYERVGPGMPDILRRLGKGKEGFEQVPDFDDFLLARQAIELKDRGTVVKYVKDPKTGKKARVVEDKIKTGVPIEDLKDPETDAVIGLGAKSIVAAAPKIFHKIAGSNAPGDPNNTLAAFQRHELRYAQKSGLFSEDAIDAMIELNVLFAPLNRVIEGEVRGGAQKGTSPRPIFERKGSEKLILSPLQNIARNVYALKAAADKNESNRAFFDLVRESPIGDQYAIKVKPKIKPIRLDKREIEKFVKAYHRAAETDVDAAEVKALSAEVEGLIDIFRPQPVQVGRNQVAEYVDGKRHVWEIKDADLYRTWNAGSPKLSNPIGKALQFPAKMLRAGAIGNPNFQVMNVPRDAIWTLFVLPKLFVPGWDTFRGAAALATNREGSIGTRAGFNVDEAFDRWMISGGPMSALQTVDRVYLDLTIKEMFYDTDLISNYRNVMHPLALLQAISSASEGINRIGAFKVMGGVTNRTKDGILEAGKESRALMDFNRLGVYGEMVNRYSSFFSVGIQGPDVLFRAFKDRPGPTSARVTIGAVIPALVIYLLNKDEDWFKGIPDHERNLFMHIPVGPRDNPWFIGRIARGFEAGLLFGRGVERMADFFLNENPKAFDGFLSDIFKGIVVDALPVPQAVLPILESLPPRGYSAFRGRPLIGLGMERMLPQAQWTPYTTELTKSIGNALRAIPGLEANRLTSPIILDNAISLWTGGLGRYILKATDWGMRKSGVLPEGTVKPAWKLKDIPGIGALVLRYPTLSDQRIIDFFEHYDHVQRVHNTLKFLAKQPEGWEAREEIVRIFGFQQINPEGVRDSISIANLSLRNINATRDMDPIQKQQQIETIYRDIVGFAKDGLEFYKMIDDDRLKELEEQSTR
jgi:hypothetical protein